MAFQLSVEGRMPGRRVVSLQPGANVIGRVGRVEVPLEGPGVSRLHAKLVVEDARVTLLDLGSHNGTFVNGERVGTRPVATGDRIYVGGYCLTLENTTPQRDSLGSEGGLVRGVVGAEVLQAAAAGRTGRPEAFTQPEARLRGAAMLARSADLLARGVRGDQRDLLVLGLLKDLLQAEAVTLVLLDEKRQLEIRHVVGVPRQEVRVCRPATRVSVTDRAVLASRDRPVNLDPFDPAKGPPVALLLCPVLLDPAGPSLGTLHVTRPYTPGGFQDHEVDLAAAVGHVLALRLSGAVTDAETDSLATAGEGGISADRMRAVLSHVLAAEVAEVVVAAAAGQSPSVAPVTSSDHVVVFFELLGLEDWALTQPVEELAKVVVALHAEAQAVATVSGGRLDRGVGPCGFFRFWEGEAPDRAHAGVRAALELRARMEAVGAGLGLGMALRVGVDAGHVVVGVFMEGVRAGFSALGSPMGVAQQVAQVARPGEVYVTSGLRARLGSAPGWRLVAMGPYALRGRQNEVVDLFRVDGAQAGGA
jgi:hypothetical protein